MDKYPQLKYNGRMSVEASDILIFLKDERKPGMFDKSVATGNINGFNKKSPTVYEQISYHLMREVR